MNSRENTGNNPRDIPIGEHSQTKNMNKKHTTSSESNDLDKKPKTTHNKRKKKKKNKNKWYNKSLWRQEFLIKKFLQNRELQIQKSRLEAELQNKTRHRSFRLKSH